MSSSTKSARFSWTVAPHSSPPEELVLFPSQLHEALQRRHWRDLVAVVHADCLVANTEVSRGRDSSLTTTDMAVRVYVRVLAERPVNSTTIGNRKSPPVFMPDIEVEPCR